jgi:hypothetical protein
MTNILTAAEASGVLRGVAEDDAELLALLPLIDTYIERATGRDWAVDNPIDNGAKAAARMILVQWHENPAQVGASGLRSLNLGIDAALTQLEAEALKHREYQIEGASTTGYIYLEKARKGDQVEALVGIWGVSGDQSDKFESVISQDYYIQQTSSSDLSDNAYKVTLISALDAVD